MNNNTDYHIPVLLQQSVDGLALKKDAIVVDVTFGGGGHSQYILSKLDEQGYLYALDQDQDAFANTLDAPNFQLIKGNFKFLKNHLAVKGVTKVDAILADIGVSSHQFDIADRGFTFRSNAVLDMRMNQQSQVSAQTVLNEYDEEQLLTMFRSYSDITNAYSLTQKILAFRQERSFKNTQELIDIGMGIAPKFKEHKYLAQIFQAIRIEVNEEIDALEGLLKDASQILNPGGRLAVISYHSVEDRLVKNFFKRGSFDGKISKDFFGNIQKPFNEINRHPIVPNDDEIIRNQRSRSAKLRIAEKL